MAEKLLPCPFCGGAAILKGSLEECIPLFVECSQCGITKTLGYISSEPKYDLEEIQKLWNTRTPSPDAERVKVLQQALKDVFHSESAFTLWGTLEELAKATDILLHRYDYDGHGWEILEYAYREVEKIQQDLRDAHKALEATK